MSETVEISLRRWCLPGEYKMVNGGTQQFVGFCRDFMFIMIDRSKRISMKLQWITFYFRRNKKAAEFNDLAIVAGMLCGVSLVLGELFHGLFLKLISSALSLLWLGCMVTAFHYSRQARKRIISLG